MLKQVLYNKQNKKIITIQTFKILLKTAFSLDEAVFYYSCINFIQRHEY